MLKATLSLIGYLSLPCSLFLSVSFVSAAAAPPQQILLASQPQFAVLLAAAAAGPELHAPLQLAAAHCEQQLLELLPVAADVQVRLAAACARALARAVKSVFWGGGRSPFWCCVLLLACCLSLYVSCQRFLFRAAGRAVVCAGPLASRVAAHPWDDEGAKHTTRHLRRTPRPHPCQHTNIALCAAPFC